MSNAFLQAADAMRREVTRLKGLSEAAEELEKIGSLEQASSESTQRLATLRDEVTKAEAKLADLNAGIAAVENNAINIINAARNEAQQITSAATDEAHSTRNKALEGERSLKDAAKAEAERWVAAAKLSSGELFEQKRDAEVRLIQLNTEIIAKNTELLTLSQKLEAARTQARKVMEG